MMRHALTTGPLPSLPFDFLHLRAKDRPARELLALARARRPAVPRLLINDRFDVALAAAADGVHLPSHRLAPLRYKQSFGQHLLVGVSCHSLDDVLRAEQEGADYVFLSPIFPPLSKPPVSPPLGLAALTTASQRVKIPVIALGGITAENEALCIAAGAAGIAGISFFQALPSGAP